MKGTSVQGSPRVARFAGWNRSVAALLAVLATLCASCDPPGPGGGGGACLTCPPPPPSAAGTMSALINDTLCSVMASSSPVARLLSRGENSTLVVDGVLFKPAGQFVGVMDLELYGTIGLGSYGLRSLVRNPDGTSSGSVGLLFLESRTTLWSTDETHVGTLTITRLDTVGLRVEGTFSFDGVSPETGTLKTIREGAFSSPLEVVH